MTLIINSKATDEDLKMASEDLDGYIKVVVDIQKEILTAGGTRHVDGEQRLLKQGSEQSNLWGGGMDLETGEIDFDSMINIRPSQNNPSREVLSQEIREKIIHIIRARLK